MLTLVPESEEQPTPDSLRVYGTRLREARLLRGLTAKSVAVSLNVGQVRYSRLENSESASLVSSVELAALSSALGFDEKYFLAPTSTNIQSEDMCFRAKKSLTKTSIATIGSWAGICGDILHEVFKTATPIPLGLPTLATRPGPEPAALDLRRHMGLEDYEPIAHLTRRMERAGIYVFSAPFEAGTSSRHDAVSMWVGSQRQYPIVLLRDIKSWERIRMSLAHELGHLVLHRYGKPETAEEEAFAFGGALLMPLAAFRASWPTRVTLGTLLPLKLKWGVSIGAIIERGFRAGLLRPETRTTLYKQLSSRRHPDTGLTWRVREPGWDEREPERPLLVRKLIESHFGDNALIKDISSGLAHRPPEFVEPIINGQFKLPTRPGNVVNLNQQRPERA